MAWRLPQTYEYHKSQSQKKLLKPGSNYHTSSQHKYNLKPPEDKYHCGRCNVNTGNTSRNGYSKNKVSAVKPQKLPKPRQKKVNKNDIILNNVIPNKVHPLLLALRFYCKRPVSSFSIILSGKEEKCLGGGGDPFSDVKTFVFASTLCIQICTCT